MADVGSHHFVKASSRSDRVLVPQPSQSPHDPLVSGIAVGAIRHLKADRIATELEQNVEDDRYLLVYCSFFQSGSRTFGLGTNVSPVDGGFRHGLCRRGQVHWRVYSGVGIQ